MHRFFTSGTPVVHGTTHPILCEIIRDRFELHYHDHVEMESTLEAYLNGISPQDFFDPEKNILIDAFTSGTPNDVESMPSPMKVVTAYFNSKSPDKGYYIAAKYFESLTEQLGDYTVTVVENNVPTASYVIRGLTNARNAEAMLNLQHKYSLMTLVHVCPVVSFELKHLDYQTPMAELCDLWNILADVPVNDDDEIKEDFHNFSKGTPREEIWHWFEGRHPQFIVGLAGTVIGKHHSFRKYQ